MHSIRSAQQSGVVQEPLLVAADQSLCKRLLRLLGPLLQVFASATILAGCVVFLPQYALAKPMPVAIAGMSAPDFGNLLFKIGSVLYFVAAFSALFGICAGIVAARRQLQSAAKLWATAPAFLLFMCASTLLFL